MSGSAGCAGLGLVAAGSFRSAGGDATVGGVEEFRFGVTVPPVAQLVLPGEGSTLPPRRAARGTVAMAAKYFLVRKKTLLSTD